MKQLVIACILLLHFSCTKSKCRSAKITHTEPPCSAWAIKVGNDVYPVDTLPQRFQRDSAIVCVDYELYADPRVCICCGGAIAKIKSIRYPDE